jgi:GTP cyclohydrolase II
VSQGARAAATRLRELLGPNRVALHRLRVQDGEADVLVVESDGNVPVVAVIFGSPKEGALVRLHSRCTYGEVFGSRDCDCRQQLEVSLSMMSAAGEGVFVYLDQEGRGAGSLVKAQGYAITQRDGVDTFSAYSSLGVDTDSRRYDDCGMVLDALSLSSIRLLTNNPSKARALIEMGFDVRREPLVVAAHPESADYLSAKRRHGHLL